MITKKQIQSGEIIEVGNFFSSIQTTDWWIYANDCPYSHSQVSDVRSNYTHRRMVHYFVLEDFVKRNIWKAVQDSFDCPTSLNNAYINFADDGTETSPHSDGTDSKLATILICLNPEWKREWGGYTVFFESVDSSKIIKSVCPEPRKAIFFKSSIYHYALPPIKSPGSYSRFMLALKINMDDGEKI